jgi:serine/threonine-protein kinase HipA
MARRKTHAPLTVAMNGRPVGQLRKAPSGAVDFAYDPAWLAWEHAFAVSLSLPLREDRYVGAAVQAVVDNLLPDNAQIRRRLAERVGAEGEDAYSLLAAIGRDCVGALQFLPPGVPPTPPGRTEAEPLTDEEVAEIIANLANAPLGLAGDQPFRISIAGAQEKTALLRQNGQWLRPLGATPTTHILKPQIGRLPGGIDLTHSVENEYLCMKAAAALGLPTAEVEIADLAGRRVLVVERFDRTLSRDGRLLRIPQEDMCQALGYPWTRKYEFEGGPGAVEILRLLAGSDRPAEDQRRFLKAQVLFWLLGATDGHAKNFSVRLEVGGGYALTPLYDILSAQPSVDGGQVRHRAFKLAMALGEARHYAVSQVAPRHFVQTAKAGAVGEAFARQLLRDVAEAAPAALETVVRELPAGFPEPVVMSIAQGVRQRAEQIARFLEPPLGAAAAAG